MVCSVVRTMPTPGAKTSSSRPESAIGLRCPEGEPDAVAQRLVAAVVDDRRARSHRHDERAPERCAREIDACSSCPELRRAAGRAPSAGRRDPRPRPSRPAARTRRSPAPRRPRRTSPDGPRATETAWVPPRWTSRRTQRLPSVSGSRLGGTPAPAAESSEPARARTTTVSAGMCLMPREYPLPGMAHL